jgi:hypothetical protein
MFGRMARRHSWRWLRLVLLVIAAVVALGVRRARADDAGTPDPTTLGASDFNFGVAWTDASGARAPLDANGAQSFFSKARCSCPTTVELDVGLADTALDKLGSDTLDVTLAVGNDCDNPTATDCVSIGSALTLSAQQTTAATTFSSGDLYAAAAGGACSALTQRSTRLWAVVQDAGTRLAVTPSLSLTLGAGPPNPPTDTRALTADGALQVSWTASATAAVAGYQVLCLPTPANPPAPAYDSCEAAAVAGTTMPGGTDAGTDAGASPLATLDAAELCSGLASASSSSVRVGGLTNGQSYQVAVIAIGADGTPSAPSVVATGIPGPTFGISDIYRQAGGEAQGCTVAGGATARAGWLALAIAFGLMAWLGRRWRGRGRRRSRILALAPFALAALASGPVRAQDSGASQQETDEIAALFGGGAPRGPSPANWNLELRFGPYRPDIDSEFEARGVSARPYQQVFGSGNHLMTGLELDRQIIHRHGTLAVGLGLSYFRVSAASLGADLQTRTGDQTALRLIPLSATVVYRASMVPERTKLPVAPYLKLGLDCTLWSMSETSKTTSVDGASYGWHAAAGIALLLDVLDPDGAVDLDFETGINHTSAFFEVTYVGTGLGFGGPQLQVGDATWLAGLMLEM